MNMFEVFSEFYNSMDTFSLFLFWIAIFAFFFLIFLSISLYVKNKELVVIINNLKNNKVKPETIEPIFDKKEEVVEKIDANEEIKTEIEEVKEEDKKDVVEGPYSKNVLRGISTRYQTSPISIKKDNDSVNIEKISKEEVVETNEDKKNLSFAEEISKKMEEELKPETIELTDYEKKQEEEAIISYQELLSASKDRLYNITDDEETIDFINELKSFRSSL